MPTDWRARREGDDPLDRWEVLAEEYEDQEESLGAALDGVAEKYFAAKVKLAEEHKKYQPGECNKCLAEAQAEFDEASRAVDLVLFPIFHGRARTAVCFSGGGVRSATFGLGVLHGLAKLDPSPLPNFNFLSTVSGGGYLGGWFSAWAARKENEIPAVAGAETVRAELARTPPLPSTLDPEPAPLLHIRKYCRFLNPKMGALSADTWALVATVARNMLLNWLILVPLLMAVLLIPVLYVSLVKLDVGATGVWIALFAGILAGVVATTYIACHLPTLSGTKKGGETDFLKWTLAPLGLSAICLSLHWVWRLQLSPYDYTFDQFMAIGAAIHSLGGVFGAIWMWKRASKALLKTLFVLIAAAVSGAVAGWLASVAAQFLRTEYDFGLQRFACLAVPFVMLAFSVAALLTVGIASQVTNDEDREWWSRAGGWLLILTVVWLIFSASVLFLPLLLKDAVTKLAAYVSTLGIGGIASRLGFSGSTAGSGPQEEKSGRQKNTSSTKDLLAKFAGPLFLLMLVGVLGILNQTLLDHVLGWLRFLDDLPEPLSSEIFGLALYVAVALIFSYFVNINRFSLHAMYRARLVRTYLGASRPDRKDTVNQFTDLDEADNLPLICLSKKKPMHIVNIALNLVGGKNLAWQQRKAESFTASRLRAGSLRLGYQGSGNYAKHGGAGQGLTLGSAITISGAAASPNMGYHSSPILSFVMTLFNARLGWWLANPGPMGQGQWQKDGPTFSFTPIINEALGRTNDESTWVYLSDGGHFENLGIYEMILRRCRTIVVVDGSQDPTYTFEDLGNAVRKARVDLGIPVEFAAGLPMYGARDVRNRYCAMGKIQYHCVDGDGVEDGTIIYIKACLNGSEPADVLHYAAADSDFPQQGTEELWFDESQFESYRRLGSHIVEEIWEKKPSTAVGKPPVDQFAAAAEKYIDAKPQIKFIGWPKPSQFVGSATGTLAPSGPGSTEVKVSLDLEQM